MPTYIKLLLSATVVATMLGSASAVSGKCGGNDASATNLDEGYYDGQQGTYYGFNCDSASTGFRRKDNPQDIELPAGKAADAAAMKAACCLGPTCTGNPPVTFFSSNADFYSTGMSSAQYWTTYNFQCGTGKHAKPNGNTIVVSGANTGAKQAVCCDDDVAGMCSGNTLPDYTNGLNYGTPAGCL